MCMLVAKSGRRFDSHPVTSNNTYWDGKEKVLMARYNRQSMGENHVSPTRQDAIRMEIRRMRKQHPRVEFFS